MTAVQKLYIKQTPLTPEINFSPEENIFIIRGISAPEDVRALYYPVIEWITTFIDDLIEVKSNKYTPGEPLRFQADLFYFNSSSAKFIYDIIFEFKRLNSAGIPVVVEWFHDEEDIDLKEAGADIALLAEMTFTFVPKHD